MIRWSLTVSLLDLEWVLPGSDVDLASEGIRVVEVLAVSRGRARQDPVDYTVVVHSCSGCHPHLGPVSVMVMLVPRVVVPGGTKDPSAILHADAELR